jgi:integrase/recombinase XerD
VIAVLYDSGCREGELANCKTKDVQWNSNGYWLMLNGKTGERRVPLVWSTQYMRAWIDIHPDKKNTNAPLLVRQRKIRGKMSDFEIAKSIIAKIVKQTAEKAGITHVYPHLFRHSRTTHLAAAGWNESELRKFLGCSGDSDMPSTYIHMGDKDMENSVLSLYGLAEKRSANVMKIDQCPQYHGLISNSDDNYCLHCSMLLTRVGEEADAVLAARVFELMQRESKL